jgi:site-specific recombinase XerD
MKTRSNEELPGLFETTSTTGLLGISVRGDRVATETEDTIIETRSALAKNLVPIDISAVTVKVFTRHSAGCPKHGDIYWRDCRCRKSIYVYRDGADRRVSAKTRSWSKAERIRQEIEESLDPVRAELKRLKEAKAAKHIEISKAVERFLSDAVARNLARKTQQGYRLICGKKLLAWCERNGLRYLDELTTAQLTTWRSTWRVGPATSKTQQRRTLTFFEFCMRQGWLERNPARWLTQIRVRRVPTDYFPLDEFERLVDATYLLEGAPRGRDLFGELRQNRAATKAVRLRTILLLMRWSGLRISDAVTLERSRLIGDRILLYQAKTGEPVYVPLPSEVAVLLREVPPGKAPNPRYFFWSNGCTADTAIRKWHFRFRQLFQIADIRNPDGSAKWCHPHMLRDTFAIELLLAGVQIDQVSKLLGHSSITTTERYYAPWVRARQEQLEKSVRKAHLVPGLTKSARKAVSTQRLKRPAKKAA